MIYKIVNNQAPVYFKNILPNKVSDINTYPVRNSENFITKNYRLECFKRSFIPYGCALWNDLDLSIRNSASLSIFSNALVPPYFKNVEQRLQKTLYSFGDRFLCSMHCQLCVGCSKLNSHLYSNLRVLDSPKCSCGAAVESVHHYFFQCENYKDIRVTLMNSVSEICRVSLKLLLYGDAKLSGDDNKTIFSYVQKFIMDSKRFDN